MSQNDHNCPKPLNHANRRELRQIIQDLNQIKSLANEISPSDPLLAHAVIQFMERAIRQFEMRLRIPVAAPTIFRP